MTTFDLSRRLFSRVGWRQLGIFRSIACASISNQSSKTQKERLNELLKLPLEELKSFACSSSVVPCGNDAFTIALQVLAAETARLFLETSEQGLVLPSNSSYTGPVIPTMNGMPAITSDWVKEMCSYMQRLVGPLPKDHVIYVLRQAAVMHSHLPNVTEIEVPYWKDDSDEAKSKAKDLECKVTVVGDTHGQFFDLMNLLSNNIAGYPSPNTPFVFNGDFVDRGVYSFEVTFALLAMKVASPQSVHLLRGNHETTDMNETYGFAKQILEKYDSEVLEMFRTVFRSLPLAATISKKVFVTHGGLGKLTANMKVLDIQNLYRFVEPEFPSAVSELLWSDPTEKLHGLSENTQRGAGWRFGKDITNSFLYNNDLELFVRSHEVRQEGYSVEHDGRCVTIFSAPNYCDVQGNLGAVLVFERKAHKEQRRKKDENANDDDDDDDGDGDSIEVANANFNNLSHAGMSEGESIVASLLQFKAVPHPLQRPLKKKSS